MAEVHSFCTLCKSKCGAIYTVEKGRLLSARPDSRHPTGAAMCPKGRAAPEIAHGSGRLTRPLRRTTPKSDPDPRWKEISWDEALTEIADRLGRIAAESGPRSVAFAMTTPSGTSLADSVDWIERLARAFGSPNICYSVEICNWQKDYAHGFTFGSALPTPDFAQADLAMLWGFNPAKTWLSQSAALSDAQSRGTRLAVIDPRKSTSALRADHWLRVRPGTDAALAMGIANILLESGQYDSEFLRRWSNGPLLVRDDNGRLLRAGELVADAPGFVAWDEGAGQPYPYDTRFAVDRPERLALRGRRRVRTLWGEEVTCVPAFQHYAEACAQWPLDRVVQETWVDRTQLCAFAEELGQSRSVAYFSWTGITQHVNATQSERAIATLYSLTGCYDAPGGNVVLPKHATYSPVSAELLASALQAGPLGIAERPLGPPSKGWVTPRDVCAAIETRKPYPVRALIGFGSNLVVSQPDSARTARALRQLEFQVHLDLFHNPTSQSADIVLPVNSAYEHEALRIGFEISHRAQEHIQLRPQLIEPVGESRSDTEVVFDLAQRLGLGKSFFGGDVEAGWNHQLGALGLTVKELRLKRGGVRVPLRLRHRKYAEVVAPDGTVAGFATPTRRVELYSEQLAEHGHSPVPQHVRSTQHDSSYPLILTSAKNGYYCHSQHRSIASLRRRSPDPVVELSPQAAAASGVFDGQWVRVVTPRAMVRMRARIDPSLHPEVAVAEYGWWQAAPELGLPGADPLSAAGSNYNLLVGDDERDPVSGAAPLRSAVCRITAEPNDGAWQGTREFTVASMEPAGEGVRALRLEPTDGGALPDYRAGQHVSVRRIDGVADTPVVRSYSLTGPAIEPDRSAYRVGIGHVPEGTFSGYVHKELGVGDHLGLTSPSGVFAIPTQLDSPVVMVAGGIGITPFLGYLETLAATGGTVPEVVLHHGSKDSAHHAFRLRLAQLMGRVPQLHTLNHYQDPAPHDRKGVDYDFSGVIAADDIDPRLIEQRARFYLCGPEPMLRMITDGLVRRGVPRFDIFSEKFRAVARDVTIPDDARHTVQFARSGTTLSWTKPDGTLLEAAERAGVTLPSGCRLGQCESCAVTVLKGTVTHLVAPSQDLPDQQCLVCQSVPAADLVLDA